MFTDPVKNLKALGLHENSIVADLGAGTGFYSVAAGHLVPNGKVYAVEIVKDYLTAIQNKVRDAGLTNVECFWGNIEQIGGTKIGDGVVDVALAANVLFQVEDKGTFLKEIKRILKKRGKVLLVDWSESSVMMKKHIVPELEARKMFEAEGFSFERSIDAGAHHYGMILVNR